MMSKWPDGFDVHVGEHQGGWFCTVVDRRPGIAVMYLPGYTTRQDAEVAALGWIQRRIGVPETVPQPVLRNCCSWQFEKDRIDYMLERLADFEAYFEVLFPAPRQADFPDEQQHIAAADCWQYRCGLIDGLRKSLREELEMIRENL